MGKQESARRREKQLGTPNNKKYEVIIKSLLNLNNRNHSENEEIKKYQ